MAAYLIRRLWQMIPTLLGVVLLVFLLFKFFGGDPAEILAGYFYGEVLGGQGFDDGTFDGVTTSGDQDVASFSLTLEDGSPFTLLVYVGSDLAVCDFL